jgi:hypothetical protein
VDILIVLLKFKEKEVLATKKAEESIKKIDTWLKPIHDKTDPKYSQKKNHLDGKREIEIKSLM